MNTLKTKHCHINSLSRSSKVAVYTDEDKKMNTNRNRTRTRTRPNLCINTPPAGKQSVWNLQISPLQLLPHSWSPPLPINSGPPPYQSTPAPQIMYATSPRNDTSRREGERERERMAATSPSEQRPLGMDVAEEGTTRRWWSRPPPPADPLDVEGNATATAFSRCLSSASLIRFRSSPAPPPPPGLYISAPDQPPATLPPEPALCHAVHAIAAAARRWARARVGLGFASGGGGVEERKEQEGREGRATNFEGPEGVNANSSEEVGINQSR
jgi:hypothetical protein